MLCNDSRWFKGKIFKSYIRSKNPGLDIKSQGLIKHQKQLV